MSEPIIDWTVSHRYSEYEIECVCGRVYRSHSKHVMHEGRLVGVTEKPCPDCGKTSDHIRRASSGPEEWTL